MNRKKGYLIGCGVTALVGAGMVWAVLGLYGYRGAAGPERLKILCDAFTIPGVFITLLGVLVFISNQGAFEGISYVLSRFARMMVPGPKKAESAYYDYIKKRREKGGVKGYSFLFTVGLSFFAVALVFYVMFYQAV